MNQIFQKIEFRVLDRCYCGSKISHKFLSKIVLGDMGKIQLDFSIAYHILEL